MSPATTPQSSSTPEGAPLLLAHWVIFAVVCSVAGWLLSALHFLNPVGFLVAIPVLHVALVKLCRIGLPDPRIILRKPRLARWKKPLPACFILIALCALAGGILHPPSNLDALHYRMPRVAHWLMAERWDWFPANNNAQNTRSCGFEWMTAPLISLSGTDRFIFLINSVSFLLLPSACFMLFRGMGLSRRVSWTWMWLTPTGYCFALQAGSIGNDLLPSLFAVAAFAFAFRWKSNGGFAWFALAMASAAAMTASKPSTLPLLLPFAVIFFGMWKIALAHPLRTSALAVIVAFGSFLPTAALNVHHCGDWTGLAAENPDFAKVEPVIGIAGNLINAPLQNLAPPVFPLANSWNAFFVGLFPDEFLAAMARSFEPAGAVFTLPDLQGEEWAGYGAGLTYLLLCTVAIAWLRRRHQPPIASPRTAMLYALLFGTALLVYFSKTGLFTVARHISPFYPFLTGVLLMTARTDFLIRRTLWTWAAVAAMASSLVMVIITPARPLWPAQTFFASFGENPASAVIARASEGYTIYQDRANALGLLRDALPEDATEIGFMSFGAGSEMPFWKPYGTMRVHHIHPGDSIEQIANRGISHVVISTRNFEPIAGISPEAWIAQRSGTIIHREMIQITTKEPASDWWLVEFQIP